MMREICVELDPAAIARLIEPVGRTPRIGRRRVIDAALVIAMEGRSDGAEVDRNPLASAGAEIPEIGSRNARSGDDCSTGGPEEIIREEDWVLASDGHFVIGYGRTLHKVQQMCKRLVSSSHSHAPCLLLSPRHSSKVPPVMADGPERPPPMQVPLRVSAPCYALSPTVWSPKAVYG